MDRDAVQRWVADYERLWRTAGTDGLARLFAPSAVYLPSPWARPISGIEAIRQFWDAERDAPDEDFTMSSDVVAVEGDTAVVRVSVTYGAPPDSEWRDLWVLRFDAHGLCTAFEEWPFAPDQPDGH